VLTGVIEPLLRSDRLTRPLQSTNRVIVNADDFGLHRSINDAIALAHSEGIVTSTSLMPYGFAPAFDHALSKTEVLPNLDIGLHFTLVGADGLPGTFKEFLGRKISGEFPAVWIEDLLRRQLESLLSRNIKVTHIDSHQHLHALPSIMAVVAKVASEYGIRAVRLPRESMGYFGAKSGRVVASKCLYLLANFSKKYLDTNGIAYTDHFAGMAVSGKLTPSVLARIVNHLTPGTTEIICHPGASNDDLSKQFDWGYNWEHELRAVTSVDNKFAIRDRGAELYSFERLAADHSKTS
jgi:chitin disaccharide deacetylase